MRRVVPFVLMGLVAATPLPAVAAPPASEDPLEGKAADLPAPAVAPLIVEDAPAAPEVRLQSVQVEERVAADEADAAQWPRRGSFWWLVGVIVVAGVILAVLL